MSTIFLFPFFLEGWGVAGCARNQWSLSESPFTPVGTLVPVHNLGVAASWLAAAVLCSVWCAMTPGRECTGSLPSYL